MRTWFQWVGLVLVAALAIAYVAVVHGSVQERRGETFEDAGSPTSPTCLTLPTLNRYMNASTSMEKALKLVVSVYDEYAKKVGESSEATGNVQPIPGEEVNDKPSVPGVDGKGTDSFGGAQMDGGSTGSLGGGLTASTTGTDVGMQSTPSFEGFANAKAPCIRNPKVLQWAQTQYKERPLALLKVYNELRTRVDKGIEGLTRIRKMNDKSKAQQKQRLQQTKAIQKAGVAQKASLNNYYDQGGSA